MRISDWSSDVCSSDLENPHSWRSSWLLGWLLPLCLIALSLTIPSMRDVAAVWFSAWALLLILVDSEIGGDAALLRRPLRVRSEEHTSELQSLMLISYAVFCLQKKNTQKQ